jgi:hypothetical protein
MIGQMSTTMSSWTTWYASYQFTVLGEYPGTSATGRNAVTAGGLSFAGASIRESGLPVSDREAVFSHPG